MARLPRLAIGGEVHLVGHGGHNQQRIFDDDDDRALLLQILREASQRAGVALHAYVLLRTNLWLLATPRDAAALGRMMQSLGRRYTASFNRRHGRTGTLWDGRFRSAIVEPGDPALRAMLFVEQAPVRDVLVTRPAAYRWSSAAHHVGASADSLIVDAAAYWGLGNTPFDRQHRYAERLDEPLEPLVVLAITSAVRGGWAIGSPSFAESLRRRGARRAVARPRGRPPKTFP